MNILGISAYYHDSAAAIIVDGCIIAAAQEERFTRVKHDSSFPIEACKYCLAEAKLTLNDIDKVVFYEKPFIKFERILETHIRVAPKSIKTFLKTMPIWLKTKLNMRKLIKKELSFLGEYNGMIFFSEHHLSHAAFAYYTSDSQTSFRDSRIRPAAILSSVKPISMNFSWSLGSAPSSPQIPAQMPFSFAALAMCAISASRAG